jgi:hypothetical protein
VSLIREGGGVIGFNIVIIQMKKLVSKWEILIAEGGKYIET